MNEMLVLSREKDQKVIITVPPSVTPTRITVEPVDTRPDKIRLGFEAPDAVIIDREEVDRRKLAGWKPITATEPPQGVAVLTRIDDGRGPRNEARLKRSGPLWFFEDGSMYVYYTPTHYMPN